MGNIVWAFSIDELIGKLQEARAVLGGEAPVLMVDEEPVCACITRPERMAVYLSDRCKGMDE